jgi:hypothetical protein
VVPEEVEVHEASAGVSVYVVMQFQPLQGCAHDILKRLRAQ